EAGYIESLVGERRCAHDLERAVAEPIENGGALVLRDLAGERHGRGAGSGEQLRESLTVVDATRENEHAAACPSLPHHEIDDESVAIRIVGEVAHDGGMGLGVRGRSGCDRNDSWHDQVAGGY